uniref:Genome polyprotein n=1 Tax=Picornavirales sp. TaxID=1955153 RepID=A0A6M9Z846_9VIRU|nr:MAG: hypothetical protein [Picornavirales sp.]
MSAYKTCWNGKEDFFTFLKRKDMRVIDLWTKKKDLPYAVEAKPGVYCCLKDQPDAPFIWSYNLSRDDNNEDLCFSYGNVQGVLNILWKMYDNDLVKFRKTLKGKFHDTPVKRWNTFYISACWRVLSAIMLKIYKEKEVVREMYRVMPTVVPLVAPVTETVFSELLERPIECVTVDLPRKDVVAMEFTAEGDDLLIIPMEKSDVSMEGKVVESSYTACGNIDLATKNLLRLRDPKCSSKLKKLRTRIDRMRGHLKRNCVTCVCARCCYRVLLTSKFSSTIIKRVCQANPQMADAPPPPNLKSKTLKSIVGAIRTVRAAAERHQEKMYVLCKIGRFADNQGNWDELLYHRQKVKLANAYTAFHFFLSTTCIGVNVGEPDLTDVTHSYWRQADRLLDACQKYSDKINKTTETVKIIKYLKRFQNLLYTIVHNLQGPFDPANVHYVEFADEEEGIAGEVEVLGRLEDLVIGAVPQMADGEKLTASAAPPDPTQKKAAPSTSKGPAKKSSVKKTKGGKKRSKPDGKAIVKKDPPVEKAVTKGETNKTLVLADERTVQKETLKKTVTEKPDSNAEKNQQMDNVFKRMMFIARYLWNEATPVSDSLDAFMLPGAYFSFASQKAEKACQPLTVNNILCNYGFVRFDMRVRIQINSSKMASGLLLVYFEPFLFAERQNYATSQSYTNFPHIWINVCESTSAEFVIPWCNMRDYFPIYWDNNAEYNYWGYLHIRPWTAIRAGASTSASATISVYMGFENWEVHQQVNPKSPTAITFTQDVIPTDFPGYSTNQIIPKPESYFKVIKEDSNVELQMEAGIGEILGAAPEVGAVLMEHLAKSLSRLSADAPLANATPANARLEVANVPAHGDGPKNAKVLGLTSCRQTPMKNRFLDSIAPSGYKDLMKMESYVYSFDLKTSNKENDGLFTWCVCPMMARYVGERNVTMNTQGEIELNRDPLEWSEYKQSWNSTFVSLAPTMLCYLAMGHLWWRGSLNWRFQAVKTPMHTARLGLRYQPSGGVTGKENECQKISQPSVIWDLQESDELKLTTEYAAPQPFLSTKWYGISLKATESIAVGNFACGTAEMFVVNPMKVGTGVSDTVTINVYLSAGPDFEFAGTADLGVIAGIGKFPTFKFAAIDGVTFPVGTRYLEFLWAFCSDAATEDLDAIKFVPSGNKKEIGVPKTQEGATELMFKLNNTKFATEYAKKFKKVLELWKGVMKTRKTDARIDIPRYTRKSYDAAMHFVSNIGFENTIMYDRLTQVQKITLMKGLAVAHMGPHAVKLSWMPDFANFPLLYRDGASITRCGTVSLEDVPKARVELQMADKEEEGLTHDAPLVKGINPFTDGTCVDLASVHELYGEHFNDMYQRLRRQYCVANWTYPRYRDSTDKWFDQWQIDFAVMNPEEFDTMYWEVGIPVTPAQNIGYIGDGNAYASVGANVGKFLSSPNLLPKMGVNWGNDYTMTPLTWLSEIFTFWRGDLRFSFFFPSSVELHATVVHIPDDYGYAYTSINNEAELSRVTNFGNVLYKGNVMGELSVEVPWCSKYPRLVLSRNGNSAITQNGSIRMFVKIQRSEWNRKFPIEKAKDVNTPTANYQPVDPLKFRLYMSFGETAELLVPRAAPRLFLYKDWYSYIHTDKFIYDNYDSIDETTVKKVDRSDLGDNISRVIKPTLEGGYEKPLRAIHRKHPVFHTGSVETIHRYTSAEYDELKKLPDSLMYTYKEDKKESVELQDDDGIQVSKEVYDAFHHCDVTDSATGAFRLSLDEVVSGGMHTLMSIPVVLNKFNKLMEQTSSTWSVTEGAMTALKSAGEKTANLVGNVVPKLWDATRIGLIGYAIYTFLNTEDWHGKAMALLSGAMAMGLNYEIVKRSFDWLIASISSLFSKQEEQETVVVQEDGEDDTVGDFARFVIRHSQPLKLVASAVGAFAIFSMCPTGVPKMENGVRGFASSMVGKLRNLTIVGAGFKTFEWLFEWIGKMFKYAFEWACDLVTGGMLTKKALVVQYPMVLDWLTRIEKYKSENDLTKAAWDYEVQMDIWRLMDKGKEYAEGVGKKEQFLAGYIAQGSKNLADIHAKTIANNMSVPFRVDPFCIWLYGAPGVGKSAMANGLGDFIGDFIDLPHTNRVYARNEDEEFWSGYIGQPVIMIDDICQNKKGHAVHEFIRMKSNNEVQVPMASLTEKGRKFRSQIIIATSNMGYPTPEDMASSQALWRRRNMLVRVKKGVGNRKGARYCMFDIMHPVNVDQIVREDVSYADLAAYAAQEARDYLIEQNSLVGSNLKGRKVPKMHPMQENADAVHDLFRETLFRVGGEIMVSKTPRVKDLEFLASMGEANIDTCIRRSTRFELRGMWDIVTPVVEAYKTRRDGQERAIMLAVKDVVDGIERAKENTVPQLPEQIELHAGDEEEFNRLRDTAWDIQDADERKYVGYKKLLCSKFYETTWTHVADDGEIRKVVRELYPDLSEDEVVVKVEDWTKIFNSANSMNQINTGETETPKSFEANLKKEDFRNMFVITSTGDWSIVALPENPTDAQFDAAAAWETVLAHMTVKDRNEMLSAMMERLKNKTVLKHEGVSATLKHWVKTKSNQVWKYFEDHPWIYSTLKMGAMAAGFFLGYKLLRWICKDYTDKIERKLCEYFGVLKETKYVQYVADKAIVVKDWTKNTALVKKISSLIAKEVGEEQAVTEAQILPIVEDALVKGILPSLTSVDKMRKKGVPSAYYMGERQKAVTQGSADQGADDVRKLIMGNFVRLKAVIGDRAKNLLGIIVDRNFLLTPLHYFDQMEERTEMTLTFYNGSQKETHIELFSPSKLRQIAKLDAAVYQLGFGFRPKKKITQHFMTMTDLPHVSKTGANLVTLTSDDILVQHIVDAKRRGGLTYQDDCVINYDVENLNVFEYDAGTTKGDCGSILIARNNGIRKKILGMHVAGLVDRDIGFSVCIPAETLEATIQSFPENESMIQLPEQLELQEAFPHYIVDPSEVIMPKGEFHLQGIIAKHLEVKLPIKTDIRKSPIHGMVRPPVTEPSILSVSDPRWTFEGSPLFNAVEKYGKKSKPFYYDDMKYVVSDVASDWYGWKLTMEPRVLTDHEAVFGNEAIPYCDRMNLTSSAGFPFVKWNNKKGKAWLYDQESFDGIKDEKYRQMYIQREENAKVRKRTPHLWISCLKDERRKMSKIQQGKTRVFMIAGADWVQLFRKYFLAFYVNFYANAGKFYSAVGVDPFSMDWTVIFRRLSTVGKKGFGIDFENFDGLTDADLMMMLIEEVNRWYKVKDPNWKKEDDNVRLTLGSDCVHSLFLVGCEMLWKKKGNPSGNPGTTVLNTKVHACYLRLAMMSIVRLMKRVCKEQNLHLPNELLSRLIDLPMKMYRTGVREITYGDDGVIGVADWLQMFFNLKTVTSALSYHGIVSTPENKEDEVYEVQPLLDCTFLKCGFVPLEGRECFYLAPIAKDTIFELTNWVRKSDDAVAQLRVNLHDALKFAFHWGLDFYRKFSTDVNNVMHERGLKPVVASYHIERDNFLDKCM